ncbi:MAG TPA: CoA transferase [Paracoccaceae bacterium]|nr:CoA transferase [Paracoccaceae bacterium]
MYELLKDITVVEGASFIAGPSCALHLSQMGAKVIRCDTIGGGPDYRRWPLDAQGHSLYWEGLNKGKRSIAIDLSRPEGRELAVALVTAPGEGRGLFVTNFPLESFLSHDRLAARRPDLITVRILGWPSGRNGVDYTINAAVGVPFMTGPEDLPFDEPVNNSLPAWDLLAGAYGAFALLSAERRRRATGQGGEWRLALSDLAIGSLAHLGQVAEVSQGSSRGRFGNALYGALGNAFRTSDGRRLMVVAITARQWSGLVSALGISAAVAELERLLGVSFVRDEGVRFRYRQPLCDLIGGAIGGMSFTEVTARMEQAGVCWEPYQTLHQAVETDPRLVRDNPLFAEVEHPGGGRYPTPGALARLAVEPARMPASAPRLGEHTDEILADDLGLSSAEIARLHDAGIVAGAGGGG